MLQPFLKAPNASVQWPGNCARVAQRLTDRVRQDTVRCNAMLGHSTFFLIINEALSK